MFWQEEIQTFSCDRNRRPTGRPFSFTPQPAPQPSTNHIHQITTIAQRNGQQFGKVGKHNRVATNLGAKRDVFQHLSNGANAVVSHGVQNIEWSWGSISSDAGIKSIPVRGMYLSLTATNIATSCNEMPNQRRAQHPYRPSTPTLKWIHSLTSE